MAKKKPAKPRKPRPPAKPEPSGPRTLRGRIAGVSYKNDDGSDRQAIIRRRCRAGMRLELRPEPKNKHDRNAIAAWISWRSLLIFSGSAQLGYLERDDAAAVAKHLKAGGRARARVVEVMGGTRDKPSRGVLIEVDLV